MKPPTIGQDMRRLMPSSYQLSRELWLLRKRFATVVLDNWHSWGCGADIPDPAVKALVENDDDSPIGVCDACGERAPLRHMTCSTGETSQCAWGCT